MALLEGKNLVRSRIIDSQHSFNFHNPESPSATKILKDAFQTAQERILYVQQQKFPHAVFSLGNVSVPRKIIASGVHSIQYDIVPASSLVSRFQETAKEVITRLQLPIDAIVKASVLYGETQSPELLMQLNLDGKETTLIITESEWQDWSALGLTPRSMIFVEAIRENRDKAPRSLERARIGIERVPGPLYPPTVKPDLEGIEGQERGRRIQEAKAHNEEVVKEYAGSLWKPSWNSLEVRNFSYRPEGEDVHELSWHTDGENTEGVLINNFNQFIQGADFEGKLLG